MAMPSAKGLFHRAIIESSPALRALDARRATDAAERLLAKLEIKATQIEKLQKVPMKKLLAATVATFTNSGVFRVQNIICQPVVDGAYLLANPFDPVAAPTAADITLLIGTNRDEKALFLTNDPKNGKLSEPEMRERLKIMLGDRLDQVLSIYQRTRPHATPWDLFVGISSEDRRIGCINLV